MTSPIRQGTRPTDSSVMWQSSSPRDRYRFPIEEPDKTRKASIFVIVWDVWFIFMVSLWKRYGQKLRSIILLQLELITCRFHYWRTLKPLIFLISGFSDVLFGVFYFYKSHFSILKILKMLDKTVAEASWRSAYFCLQILNTGSISSWKHKMGTW